MSSSGDRLEFAAPATHSEAMVEDFMAILIRHTDDKITLLGEAEITAFRSEMMPFLPAYYTAINAIFGVLGDPYKHCYAYAKKRDLSPIRQVQVVASLEMALVLVDSISKKG